MKSLILSLLLVASPAFAGECPPRNLTGLNYHVARSKLIIAGCLPVPQPNYKAASNGDPRNDDADALGYLESLGPSSQGYAWRSFRWAASDGHRFDVVTKGCEYLLSPGACIVKKIIPAH